MEAMATPILLSQRDPKWKDQKLGFSKDATIGAFGCTITVIGMKFGVTPDVVNERLKAVNGFLDETLVIWKKLEEALPGVRFNWKYAAYDNTVVKANIPCIVEVSGEKIGGQRHWVLFIGNKRMYDPWDGTEKDTMAYGTPLSFVVMEGEYTKPVEAPGDCLVPNTPEWRKKYEELVDKASKYDAIHKAGYGSVEIIRALLEEKESIIRNMNKSAVSLTKEELSAFTHEVGGIIRATTLIGEWATRWRERLATDAASEIPKKTETKPKEEVVETTEGDIVSWMKRTLGIIEKGVKNT